MTLADIITEVRQELQETSAVFWTDSEITGYANDAVLLMQQLTEWLEDTANIIMVANQQEYSFPSNQLVMRRITWDRNFLPQTNYFELDRDNPSWRTATHNDPIRHYESNWDKLDSYPIPSRDGTTWTFDSELGVLIAIYDGASVSTDATFDSELGIVIAVEDTEGGMSLFLADTLNDAFTTTSPELGVIISGSTDELNFACYYSALPDVMTATTNTPQNHPCTHPAIIPYCVYRCLVREGVHQQQMGMKQCSILARGYFEDFSDWMQQVLAVRGRQFPDRVWSLEAIQTGSFFASRLSSIGPPVLANLLPSYPSYQS